MTGAEPVGVSLSDRAREKLAELRALHPWAQDGVTTIVRDDKGRNRWWTFAGWKANLALAQVMSDLRHEVAAVDDLTTALDPGPDLDQANRALRSATDRKVDLAASIVVEALEGLKFAECLPPELAVAMVTRRLADPASVNVVLGERLASWHSVHG